MIESIAMTPDDARGLRVAAFAGAEWLLEVSVQSLDGTPAPQRSGAGESVLIVLSGTHDLFAGGGSWLRRGIRETPFAGRPVALFLPPGTPYRATDGRGELLTFLVRQPPQAKAEPAAALSMSPLLPMAGSGKAFDPTSGTWQPKGAFLSSPEAILPRRIAAIDHGGIPVQRILDADYKALGLCLDEAVVPKGRELRVVPPAGAGSEVGVWVRAPGGLVARGGTEVRIDGDGALCVRGEGVPVLRAVDADAYVAIAYAGPKRAQ
jgi:hypothetical protein